MKNNIRNIYPGGNTTKGFHSYYNFILPQNKAEKIIYLKGGPGVGKSTMMKKIGAYFEGKNESIDYMWCSSDPDSLDGVLLKDRNVAVIDGTAPHIIDPINPAAVDEILDLGRYWNREEIRKNRRQIIEITEKTGGFFDNAYGYLKIAGVEYEFLWEMLADTIDKKELSALKWQFDSKVNAMTPIRRAENKVKHDIIVGNKINRGKESSFFAGAITPMGVRNSTLSLVKSLQKVIVLETPVGFKSQLFLEPAAARFQEAGYDVEKYYCPTDPERKIEHVIIPEIKMGIITNNPFHNLHLSPKGKKVETVKVNVPPGKGVNSEIINQLIGSIRDNIDFAVKYLHMAKECHDELEKYYSSNMDHEKIDEITEEIIEKVDNMLL
ncbi:MAG: hypothetical protein GX663_08420 [Clostridiales bacterium]|nr:hypothetical protein [Clostridiales bacterium]